eukprot:SAG22_NODE_3730_length_1555_cov_1.355769_1_plen_101_part_00
MCEHAKGVLRKELSESEEEEDADSADGMPGLMPPNEEDCRTDPGPEDRWCAHGEAKRSQLEKSKATTFSAADISSTRPAFSFKFGAWVCVRHVDTQAEGT